MKPDAALLFAAGFGTRMRPLTDVRPKPLIEVGGKALLDHALGFAQQLDLPKIVVNTHYLHDQIADHLANASVTISHECPDILDTGGGLRQALPTLGNDPVFTLNTDAVWRGPNPLSLLRDNWRPEHMEALLLCVPLDRTRGREGGGDFLMNQDGHLTRGGNLVYSGAQIINSDGLHDIEDKAFSLNLLWNQMAASGRLYGVTYPGLWCDVGHPGGITIAEEMLAHV